MKFHREGIKSTTEGRDYAIKYVSLSGLYLTVKSTLITYVTLRVVPSQ
jgi:hypothetical protein